MVEGVIQTICGVVLLCAGLWLRRVLRKEADLLAKVNRELERMRQDRIDALRPQGGNSREDS